MCVCVHVWKLEVDTGIILNCFSSLSFEAEALTEPCAHQPMKAGQQTQGFACTRSAVLRIQSCAADAFPSGVMRVSTWVLMRVQQVL